MKLAPLNKSSELGSGPDLSLAKKGEGIEARPMHQLERHIAPKVLGGQTFHNIPMAGHGAHIKSLATPGMASGAMSPIPSGGLVGQ